MNLRAAESQDDKGEGIQKLLNEKNNSIQLLKKKLKIIATQLIQGPELA